MKKLSLFIALVCIVQTILISQSCMPEGITFTRQSQIDNFLINYPNCTEIEGTVRIVGDSIYNLSGLNVLQSIGGSLIFSSNKELINLTGLENLVSIGGGFTTNYIHIIPIIN